MGSPLCEWGSEGREEKARVGRGWRRGRQHRGWRTKWAPRVPVGTALKPPALFEGTHSLSGLGTQTWASPISLVKKNKTPKWFSEHSVHLSDAGNFSGKDPDKVQLSLTWATVQRTPSPTLKVSAALRNHHCISAICVFLHQFLLSF